MRRFSKLITTKAYITAVPEQGSNTFKVNVPLMSDNVSDEAIFDALLCSTSGSYNDYKVGDCVFVDFEDDKYNTAWVSYILKCQKKMVLLVYIMNLKLQVQLYYQKIQELGSFHHKIFLISIKQLTI